MNAPKGVSHVSLSVRDLEVSNEWYKRVLGLKTMVPPFEREHDSEAMDLKCSPTWVELASQFKIGTDVFLPELTHLIPMQEPGLVARYILDGKDSEK